MQNPSQSYGASPAIWKCYPTQVNVAHLNPSHAGRYSICLPRRDGRLSWPWWLVIYRDGLPVRRQTVAHPGSNHLIATRPGVEPTTSHSQVTRPNRYRVRGVPAQSDQLQLCTYWTYWNRFSGAIFCRIVRSNCHLVSDVCTVYHVVLSFFLSFIVNWYARRSVHAVQLIVVLCEYWTFQIEQLLHYSVRNEDNYSKFSNTYRHQFLTYLTEWRRFFTLAPRVATNKINKHGVVCIVSVV